MSNKGFRSEKVVSAARYDRPKEMGGVTTHSAVKLNTEKGNSYTIHNTPKSGVVVTPASNMNPKTWTKTYDIPVKGTKTVQDALNGGYTRGSGRLGKFGEYIGSLTCKGTAHGVEKVLKK